MEYPIKLWKILFSVIILITILLLASIAVCGTNQVCRARVPTLNHLLNSNFVAPFLITALNFLLGLHLAVSNGLYYKTLEKCYYWSKLQLAASVLVYVSIVITMFVFPFTDWEKNWANIAIILALILWMMTTLMTLKRFYRHRLENRRHLLVGSFGATCIYFAGSLGYIVFRAIDLQGWILISEIVSGMGVCGFLVLLVVHIWDLQILIKT